MSSFAILTNIGRNKEAASLATGVALNIVSLAWGDGERIPAGGETSLLNEQGRKPVQAQGVVSGANNTAFFDVLISETEGPFVIREAGLFDADGDLIAIAKYDPVVNKPLNTVSALLRINIVFSDLSNLVLQVSSANAFVPAEREIIAGVGLLGGGDLSNDRTISADIATQSEALAGTINDKLITPLRLAQAIVSASVNFSTQADIDAAITALLDGAPVALDTLNELATALGDNDSALATIITQLALKLNATSYTAADVLAKIKTVDSAGSNLDADMLDGFHASYFASQAALSAMPLSKEYSSSPQAITSAGLLTLAHGLGVEPKFITITLECIVTEDGYSIGDRIEVNWNNTSSATSRVNTPRKDATNIYFRLSSKSNCFSVSNGTTGAETTLSNNKWQLYVGAFA